MVNLAQVQTGIERYIDNEILARIPDWRKWVLGAGASRMLSRSTEIFNELKLNPIVTAMGVIDDQDMIDIDTIRAEFAKQAQRGAITFNIPLMGALTLDSGDIDKIYNAIVGG